MILYPMLSAIPYVDGGGTMTPPEVTPNGTGTPGQDASDGPDDSFICLSDSGAGGFCTPACFPGDFTTSLTNAPVSCTCD